MVIHKAREWISSQSLLKLLAMIVGAGAVLGVLVPLLLVATQRWTEVRARRVHQAPGRIIDAGGLGMHLACAGLAEPGEAVVVVDADVASFSLDWVAIQDRLVEEGIRSCLYDRAGYGWSEVGGGSRTAEGAALELHTLLGASGEPGPYVIVGHGLGALNAQVYAALYPGETAGLVLVHPLTEVVLGEAYSRGWERRLDIYERLRGLTASGLLRVVRPFVKSVNPPWVDEMPAGTREAYLALLLDRAYYETAIAEITGMATSFDQVKTALRGELPLGGLPLVVLTAARSAAPDAAPFDLEMVATGDDVVVAHRAIAALSVRGERRMLGQSGPRVQFDAPDAVVAATRDVVAMARVVSDD